MTNNTLKVVVGMLLLFIGIMNLVTTPEGTKDALKFITVLANIFIGTLMVIFAMMNESEGK